MINKLCIIRKDARNDNDDLVRAANNQWLCKVVSEDTDASTFDVLVPSKRSSINPKLGSVDVKRIQVNQDEIVPAEEVFENVEEIKDE